MSFEVAAEGYQRFMGRFSAGLCGPFADFAGVTAGSRQRVLDVGCGPGVLTAELVDRLGPAQVAAIDPSPPFVDAARQRFPHTDVRQGVAERLPYDDATFDAALAQLVVHFMKDPSAGVAQMARVCRPGGVLAASVWDHHGGRGPVSPFWAAVRATDPAGADESDLSGARSGDLGRLFAEAGLVEVVDSEITATARFESFEDWWAPYLLGIGPAGDYVASLDDDGRAALEAECRRTLPEAPFELTGTAWVSRAVVPGGSGT